MARLQCESSPQPSHGSHVSQLQSYVHNYRARLVQRGTPRRKCPHRVHQLITVIERDQTAKMGDFLPKQLGLGQKGELRRTRNVSRETSSLGQTGRSRASLPRPMLSMHFAPTSLAHVSSRDPGMEISTDQEQRGECFKSSMPSGPTNTAQWDQRMDGSHNLGRSLCLSKDPTTCSSNIIYLLAEKRTCFT